MNEEVMCDEVYVDGMSLDYDGGEVFKFLLQHYPNDLMEWSIDGELIPFRAELPVEGDVYAIDIPDNPEYGKEVVLCSFFILRFLTTMGCRVFFAGDSIFLNSQMPDWLTFKTVNYLVEELNENLGEEDWEPLDMQIPKSFGIYFKDNEHDEVDD